jgi:hypothetical protein
LPNSGHGADELRGKAAHRLTHIVDGLTDTPREIRKRTTMRKFANNYQETVAKMKKKIQYTTYRPSPPSTDGKTFKEHHSQDA